MVGSTVSPVVGSTVSPRLGRNSFHKAILFGRILYLTVILELSPMYSPRSAVYWGQFVPNGVGLLGFLKSQMGKVHSNDGNALLTVHSQKIVIDLQLIKYRIPGPQLA